MIRLWLKSGMRLLGVALLALSATARAQSLDEMLGQMLVVGVAATSPSDPEVRLLEREIRAGRVGGILFLRHNLKDRAGFEGLVRHLRTLPSPHPLFLMADQEGGVVQRLNPRLGYERLPSAAAVGAQRTPQQARALYRETAALLRQVGINVNLAPVADVNVNPASPAIGALGRSFSDDPEMVSAYARVCIEAHREEGVATVLKHFPGHGSSSTDTHEGLADISKTWHRSELFPFENLIRAGVADAIMTGHLFHRSLDPRRPATLSRSIVRDVLRKKMGFDGVVMTDDVNMKSVRRQLGHERLFEEAVAAGHDLVLVSSLRRGKTLLPRLFRQTLRKAIAAGNIDPADVKDSFERLVSLKASLGAGARHSARHAPQPPPRESLQSPPK